jgi:hypothetical protein
MTSSISPHYHSDLRGFAMRNNILHLFVLLSVAGILFGGNYAEAQNNRLSPQQQETIAKLIQERSRNAALRQQIENVTDPVLVGRHVVFSTAWLELVGNGRDGTVTRQQFQAYRNRVDRLYEAYEKFVGYKPPSGTIIFIDLQRRGATAAGATYSPGANLITFNRDKENSCCMRSTRNALRSGNLVGRCMMHEVGHAFGRGAWVADMETAADLLVYYAEYRGFRANTPNPTLPLRQDRIRRILRNQQDDITAFSRDGEDGHANRYTNAYELYMYGLIDEVGWETFRRTIQSYHDGTYTPTKRYVPDSTKGQTAMHARAHEFFDRLVHFYAEERARRGLPPDRGNVLRRGPDEGVFLDRFFTVNTTPIGSPQQNIARTTPTETPPQNATWTMPMGTSSQSGQVASSCCCVASPTVSAAMAAQNDTRTNSITVPPPDAPPVSTFPQWESDEWFRRPAR